MANKNKELGKLFKEYILRSAKEKQTTYSYTPLGCRGRFNGGMNFDGINHSIGMVYFYEWSNASNLPKTFFTIDAFDRFLRTCGITLQGFEREIIEALHVSYIACKRGSKSLIIKKDHKDLREALDDGKSNPISPIYVPSMVQKSMPRVPNDQWYG